MASDVDSSLESEIRDLTQRARLASRRVANLDSATKNSLLLQLAEVLNSSQTSAELMAANSPVAVQQTLRAVDRVISAGDPLGWRATDDARKVIVASEDRKEGVAAFFERRPPAWPGR